MKTIQFEYGSGFMAAQLPDSADVFIPGETVKDPEALVDPIAATRDSILNPIGMPPISEQVKQGSKVAIVFPDRVKGGCHDTAHRRVSIPIILEECRKAGVEKKDITLICSNGLHRKNTEKELREILGDEVFNAFYWEGQVVNHDSEDWDNLVDLGRNEHGDKVVMNKTVFEADLAVMIGHTLGNPYGGYSGGYKHCATGITNWECIASHHIPRVMHRDDFTPVSSKSLMRQKFDQIGKHMELRMGKKFFTCDAVLNTFSQQLSVYTGGCEDIQPFCFTDADKRTYANWAEKKYDIMVFGMPQNFHYGNGHGTNPVLMMQAIGAQIIRHKRVMSDNCVVICSSLCNGYFHDEEFPSYRKLFELFQTDYCNTLVDINKHIEYIARDEEMIKQYRFNYGYHPFHGFSMTSCGHIAEMNTKAVYIVGAQEPGMARQMGMKTRATFEDALADAVRYTGANPNILALPQAFTRAAMHLGSKEEL
ncbi:lactate racemase domain-containing protein [Photobacterium sp. DNB22_13_2]